MYQHYNIEYTIWITKMDSSLEANTRSHWIILDLNLFIVWDGNYFLFSFHFPAAKYQDCNNKIYLKAQNSSSFTDRFWWLLDQVFPLLFPIQTSYPASARMKPKLLWAKLVIQLLPSPSKPCWRNTTGFLPEKRI